MRLDKFLKVSRLIKRRTIAKEVCTQGRVRVNGRSAKASQELKPGDIIEFEMGSRNVKVEVLISGDGPLPRDVAEIYKTVE